MDSFLDTANRAPFRHKEQPKEPDKWVVNASILASMTGCYRPAINTFIEARKQKIDELNASHGLGPGHNRATARTHPNAIPELVQSFKEEILGQPF